MNTSDEITGLNIFGYVTFPNSSYPESKQKYKFNLYDKMLRRDAANSKKNRMNTV